MPLKPPPPGDDISHSNTSDHWSPLWAHRVGTVAQKHVVGLLSTGLRSVLQGEEGS